jgi:imidazolonepropionase-like amidohydrolase
MTLQAIVGATVIDGTGRDPVADAVVIVDRERIRSVTPSTEMAVPQEAEVIDAGGRYVIPGLLDANVQLGGASTPDFLFEFDGRRSDLVVEAAQVVLKAGVTTVFNTTGPLAALVDVRDRINRGEVVGSRMFVNGHIIGFGGPVSSDGFGFGKFVGPDTVERFNAEFEQGVGEDLLWMTPDGVRARVRDYIERSGIDFVKYAGCTHLTPHITFSPEAQRVIVEEAHRAGLPVQAHTLSPESLRLAVEAGVDLLQHGNITGKESMPDDTLKTIVDRSLPIAALVCTSRYRAWVQEHGTEWARTVGFGTTTHENNQRLIDAGARLLLTVDGIVKGPRILKHPLFAPAIADAIEHSQDLGEGHFLWLKAVVEYGMAPMDALQAATRNVAKAYGQANELGTLEPGKRADLLILDADPLADPVNYRRIAEVMKDGALVDRDSLPTHRIVTADDGNRPETRRRLSCAAFPQ